MTNVFIRVRTFEREHKWRRGQKERERILSRLHTHCEPEADHNLKTEIMTRAEIKSRMLNRLNHPGAPVAGVLGRNVEGENSQDPYLGWMGQW